MKVLVDRDAGPRGPDELAVLSALLAVDGSGWSVVAGSLLTVSRDCAFHSWARWADRQPGAHSDRNSGFDLGPSFEADPFVGLRAIRRIITAEWWHEIADELEASCSFSLAFGLVSLDVVDQSPPVLFPTEGDEGSASVVQGLQRPVRGVAYTLQHPELPRSEDTWKLAYPPALEPGVALGRLHPHRRVLHWPGRLLGIDWLGSDEFQPPRFFVVGRSGSAAWIVRARPDDADERMHVTINWNEREVDPLSLSLLVRHEHEGLCVLARLVKISDLPADSPDPGAVEPRNAGWAERSLGVRLPRGPRGTDWGATLFGPDGVVLDERRVGPRLEGIVLSSWGTSPPLPPAARLTPAEAQRQAVELAHNLDAQSKRSAVDRRISDRGQLLTYLRWRLSSRAGDLLILDAFALRRDDPSRVDDLRFLGSLDRPVRVLTRKGSPLSRQEAVQFPNIEARVLGPDHLLHDRVWLVGELGLAVGASLNRIHPRRSGQPGPTTTVTELPFADAAVWRAIGESWWEDRRPVVRAG